MKKWLLCIWWFSLTACAQKAAILQKNLVKMPIDTHRVSVLYALGRAYWLEGNDSLALLYCHQSVRLAKQLSFSKGEAKARLQLVRIELEYLTDLQTAYNHLDTALKIAQIIPDLSIEGQVYLRRAQLYESFFEKKKQVRPLLEKALQVFKQAKDEVWEGAVYAEMSTQLAQEGQYAEAVDLMLKARTLQEKKNDTMALRSTIPNLGAFYVALGRYEDALQCFQEAEVIAKKLNDQRLKAYLMSQRGEIFEKQGKYTEALNSFLQAAKIHEISQATQWLPRVYGRIGGVYLLLKNYPKALQYTQAADSLYKSQIDSDEVIEHVSQINFGKIFLVKKQYRQAVAYASKGLEWATSAESPLRQEAAEYHRQLSEAYEKLGNPAKSLFHFRQYKADSDSLLNNEVAQKITVSSMTYTFDKKQQANKLRIQTLENEQLTQTRNLLIGLFVLGVMALCAVLWTNRRLNQKNRTLVQKNREIEEALFKGQNMERKRVASELHDNLNTKLAAIRWHLEAMQTDDLVPSNKKIHTRLLEMANDVYADVRLISHNMLPAELETHGLTAALQKLVEKLNINPKTKFHFVIQGSEARPAPQIEHQLYNIALELVNNVLKHAQASEVWISLSQATNQLALTVSDNGIGIQAEAKTEGMGIRNLRNRVELLAGTLQMQTAPNEGTKITVEISV